MKEDFKIIRDKDNKPIAYLIKNRWDSKTHAKSPSELRKMMVDLEKQDDSILWSLLNALIQSVAINGLVAESVNKFSPMGELRLNLSPLTIAQSAERKK